MPSRPIIEIIGDRGFHSAKPSISVRAVAHHLKEFNAGAVLVIDEESGSLLGICTERDLTFKVLAEGLNGNVTTVGEIMTHDPQTISPDKLFGHVLHLMFEGGFRHMPVIDPQGRPIGVVSARDALGLDILKFRDELEFRENVTEIL